MVQFHQVLRRSLFQRKKVMKVTKICGQLSGSKMFRRKFNQESLYFAMARRDWNAIRLRLCSGRGTKELAKGEPEYGRIPLHWACIQDAPMDIIQSLLDTYPKGTCVEDFQGNLPLHYASARCHDTSVVECLLKVFPGAADMCNNVGKLPLHVTCEHFVETKASHLIQNIHALVRANPGSIFVLDSFGNLPYTYCTKGAYLAQEVMRQDLESLLCNYYPDERDSLSHPPIH
jgi:hypothetical protein